MTNREAVGPRHPAQPTAGVSAASLLPPVAQMESCLHVCGLASIRDSIAGAYSCSTLQGKSNGSLQDSIACIMHGSSLVPPALSPCCCAANVDRMPCGPVAMLENTNGTSAPASTGIVKLWTVCLAVPLSQSAAVSALPMAQVTAQTSDRLHWGHEDFIPPTPNAGTSGNQKPFAQNLSLDLLHL